MAENSKTSLLLGISVFLGLWLLNHCSPMCTGTGCGNPAYETQSGTVYEGVFAGPAKDYFENHKSILSSGSGIDCGSYDSTNSESEIEVGRKCIREAFSACSAAIYLLDQVHDGRYRVLSFVGVEVADSLCQIHVHTASEDRSLFLGAREATCSTLAPEEPIEYACYLGTVDAIQLAK